MTDKCQANVKSRNHDRIYRGWENLRTWKKERKREGKSGGVVKRGRDKIQKTEPAF